MKLYQKIAMFMTCMCLMGVANAAGPAHVHRSEAVSRSGLLVKPDVVRAPQMQVLCGTIAQVEGDRVLVKAEDGNSVEVLYDRSTYIVDGACGKFRLPLALQAGQKVVAYHSARMTRSLPPQAQGYALVLGAQEEYLPKFMVADQVEQGDGFVKVLSANHDIIVTVTPEACAAYGEIKAGDKLLVWSKMMTMSIPAYTNGEKVVVLP